MELDAGSCMVCLGLATGISTVCVRRHGCQGMGLTLFELALQVGLYVERGREKIARQKRAKANTFAAVDGGFGRW